MGADWKLGPSLLTCSPLANTCTFYENMCVRWQRDSPYCPIGHKRLEPRNCSGLDVRPWQQEITTLARKVKQMGRFFRFSPEDSTQLHLLSLPGEKTSLREAGGERLGALGLDRPQRAGFFTRERESCWTSSSICSRVWTQGPESLALAAFLDREGGL